MLPLVLEPSVFNNSLSENLNTKKENALLFYRNLYGNISSRTSDIYEKTKAFTRNAVSSVIGESKDTQSTYKGNDPDIAYIHFKNGQKFEEFSKEVICDPQATFLKKVLLEINLHDVISLFKEYASYGLENDKQYVMRLIVLYPSIIQYTSIHFNEDELLELIKKNYVICRYIPEKFKNFEEKALKVNPAIYPYVSDSFKNTETEYIGK